MSEIWKDIPGYEGFYQASSEGRIRSVDRLDSIGRKKSGKILRQTVMSSGYFMVSLCKNADPKKKLVHRLVYSTFNAEPQKNFIVDHINEMKTDNRLENLMLLTVRENNSYTTKKIFRNLRTGVRKKNVGFSSAHKGKVIGTFKTEYEAGEAYDYAVKFGTENARAKFMKKKTSKTKGVFFENRSRRWIARGKCNGKVFQLGSFDNEKDASVARLEWEASLGV